MTQDVWPYPTDEDYLPTVNEEDFLNQAPTPIAHETEDQEIYEETLKWDKFFAEKGDVLRLPTRRDQVTGESLSLVPDFLETLTDMLLEGPGRKIDAIKYVRLSTNMGLKESKDFVDEFQYRLKI